LVACDISKWFKNLKKVSIIIIKTDEEQCLPNGLRTDFACFGRCFYLKLFNTSVFRVP